MLSSSSFVSMPEVMKSPALTSVFHFHREQSASLLLWRTYSYRYIIFPSYDLLPLISINIGTFFYLRLVFLDASDNFCCLTYVQTLKSEKIEFIVAPYEADAQLAYLSSLGEEQGGIVAVISEDSDLLAYGCPSVRT